MSIPPLDQVLSLVTPAANSRDSSRAGSSEDELFQNHLQRASNIEESSEVSSSTPSEATVRTARAPSDDSEQDNSQTAEDGQEVAESTSVADSEEKNGETVDEVVVSDAAVAIVDATVTQPQPVEPTLKTLEQPQQSGEVEVPTTPKPSVQSEGDVPAQVSTETNALGGESETSVIETELLATQLGEGDGLEDSANSGAEEIALQSKVKGEAIASAESRQQIDPAQRQNSVDTVDPLDRIAEGSSGTTQLVSLERSQESAALRQLSENQTKTEPIGKPNAAEEPAASVTQIESEISNRAALTNSEPIAQTSQAEADTTQRSNEAPPPRSLERVLGGGVPKSESPAQQTETQSPVDRARFVQRVGNAFRTAQQRNGHVQLRLSPPELGSLKIDISVRQGVLTASLETESATARNVLLDNLPALRERLAEQEIRIEKFDVDVRRDGQQPEDRSTDSRRSGNQASESPSQRGRETENEETETPVELALGLPATMTQEGLDVRI